MRLLHTADWHLGHSLHGVARDYEHCCFLDWLLDTLEHEQADALLIAGDIFDSTNPPASALALFYSFLAAARRRCPQLDIVVVAGNHDSPGRLDAPQPLLAQLGVHIVGTLPRNGAGEPDPNRLLTPLTDRRGAIAAWCAAVPFLRPADLPPSEAIEDALIAGVRQVYCQALALTRDRLGPGQALIATGHCYMTGGQLSELSERKILGGNQHALPADIFPAEANYVALGHLHLAQAVGNRAHIRYSGSPIPLSLTEADYPHQVVRADFHKGHCADLAALRVPRTVDILRIPAGHPEPLDSVLTQLRQLEVTTQPSEQQPFLEVKVRLEQPEPGLRRRVDEALDGKPVRLLRITPYYPGEAGALAELAPETHLPDLNPDTVFQQRYQQQYQNDPPPELLAAFHELLEQVQGAEAP
ncbi:MAG: exonuclease SbcCD subunit D C-terminal domain-containing protein [Candidatus Competibacteraceae bacterium]